MTVDTFIVWLHGRLGDQALVFYHRVAWIH